MDTQRQDADEKEFAEIAEKIITQVTKLIIAQINLSVQTMEKNRGKEITSVKLKKRVMKKWKMIAEWEDEELRKSW